jgi:hypothetical protein
LLLFSVIKIFIYDKGNFFEKENQESINNKILYKCFIEKNEKNEIYFYQYVRYNIDDKKDRIFCYKCNDKKCNGLITLNYNKKYNNEKFNKRK